MKRQQHAIISFNQELELRKQRADEVANQFRRDCEELDRLQTIREAASESEIQRVQNAWSDSARSRSNEEGKRQLLADKKIRVLRIKEDIQSVEKETERLVKHSLLYDKYHRESAEPQKKFQENLGQRRDDISKMYGFILTDDESESMETE